MSHSVQEWSWREGLQRSVRLSAREAPKGLDDRATLDWLGLYGQPCSSLGTSPGDDFASVLGAHPFPEPVFPFPLQFRRLLIRK